MTRSDVDELAPVATHFDHLYTELTAVQRALIAAVRDGADDPALVDRARTVLAAVAAASRAQAVGGMSAREAEAAALGARVLRTPIDARSRRRSVSCPAPAPSWQHSRPRREPR